MFYFHPLFFKIRDPFDGRSFLMCSHDPFFGTNKTRILKNGSCERALRSLYVMELSTAHIGNNIPACGLQGEVNFE